MKQCGQQEKRTTPRTGIREYQRLRRFLSKIYLYGFYKRQHFSDRNIGSADNYDFIKNLVRELIDAGPKRDSQRIARHYHRDNIRVLTDTYMYRGMDEQTDMVQYLHIFRLLADGEKTFKQIQRELELCLDHPPSPGTVRNRLHDLVCWGCVEKRPGGKYNLISDGLSQLTGEELATLYNYVCFCASATYPRVAGSFLRRRLEQLAYANKLSLPQQQTVLLRHNTNHNIFDEELIYQLMELMEQPCWVLFDDRLRLPVEIRVDARLGRWYVLCADHEYHPCMEKITNVEKLKKHNLPITDTLWQEISTHVKTAYAHTLCSAKPAQPVLVAAELRFEDAPALKAQFIRELRIGQVVQRNDKQYYEAWVNDPVELKPLLRSYANYLRILPGDHTLVQALHDDLQQMLAALSNEVAL